VVKKAYGIDLVSGDLKALEGRFDAVILAVSHSCFKELDVRGLLSDREKGVVFDVKGVLDRDSVDGRL